MWRRGDHIYNNQSLFQTRFIQHICIYHMDIRIENRTIHVSCKKKINSNKLDNIQPVQINQQQYKCRVNDTMTLKWETITGKPIDRQ